MQDSRNYEKDNPDIPMVWMFSGQGAQYFHMCKTFYFENPNFRYWMDHLDMIIARKRGYSVIDVVFDPGSTKSDIFDKTIDTHPALFMFQFALAKTLNELGFPDPDFLLGSSLGEFVAAAYADACSPEQMIIDLIDQASLLETHCPAGGMMVIIDEIASFDYPFIQENSELAGRNFDGSYVISGTDDNLGKISKKLKEMDILYQQLPVSLGFHSSLMDDARLPFLSQFDDDNYGAPAIPIISCCQGIEKTVNHYSKMHFWNIIRKPIDFQGCFEKFHSSHPKAIYIDLSPSGTMSTFVKYNLSTTGSEVIPLMSPFGEPEERIKEAIRWMSSM
nr:TPA_exp: acyltransferase [uncultured Gammaproteobacteria bacterium]